MVRAQERFPRQSLHGQATDLESRICQQIDIAFRKGTDSSDLGLSEIHSKFEYRMNALEDARKHINAARTILWNCP
jgi:hypothetical protein